MGIGRVLVCLGVTGGLWAQGVRRPPVSRTVKEGCPAVVPPSDSSTVATAADFIELKRTACAEGCPAYTVRIGGDGRVAWVGERFVEMKGSALAVIDVIPARELMQRVSGQGFGMFCTRYSQGGTGDAGATMITLSIAGRVKRVQDVGGTAPPLLRSMANDIDRVGDTAMFAAVSSAQHPDAKVKMLAAVGVDVNGQDNWGTTPLMLAARHSRMPGLISSLMQLGADPTKRDVEGKTALDYLNEAEVRSGVRDSMARGLLGGK